MVLKRAKIIVVSPSDVLRERELLLNHLPENFRRKRMEDACGVRLTPDGWESLPPQKGYAQDIINKKLLEGADIVLAVFKHKLGTPTRDVKSGKKRAVSGAAEELLYALSRGDTEKPRAMVYFFKNPPKRMDKARHTEWKRLEKFKKQVGAKVLYGIYENEEHLLDMVIRDLFQLLREDPSVSSYI